MEEENPICESYLKQGILLKEAIFYNTINKTLFLNELPTNKKK